MLEAQGWQLEIYPEAVSHWRSFGKAHYDLFLVDYDLPVVNGLEIVRRARKLAQHSHAPIVVLSELLKKPSA